MEDGPDEHGTNQTGKLVSLRADKCTLTSEHLRNVLITGLDHEPQFWQTDTYEHHSHVFGNMREAINLKNNLYSLQMQTLTLVLKLGAWTVEMVIVGTPIIKGRRGTSEAIVFRPLFWLHRNGTNYLPYVFGLDGAGAILGLCSETHSGFTSLEHGYDYEKSRGLIKASMHEWNPWKVVK